MAFNKNDYTKPPFTNGLMDLTVEECLYVQAELKEVAQSLGVDYYTYDVLLGYCTYPERWEAGEWINGDTAEYCFYYVAPEVEQPVEEEPVEPTEPDVQPEETTEEVEGE